MTFRICSNCEQGRLHKSFRDVTIAMQDVSILVKDIAGSFCDHCNEIEFDEATDSAHRYADAGDQLILQNRAVAALTARRED